jgi:hypothetical protein
MIVLLPSQQLDAMRAWDGLPGILARLPGVGLVLLRIINLLFYSRFYGKSVYLHGLIFGHRKRLCRNWWETSATEVAQLVLDYLEHPQKLEEMRSQLRSVRGQPGAAQKLTQLVQESLD